MRALLIAAMLAVGVSADGASGVSLREHFATLRASKAHERTATPLPASAAAAVLHFDISLFANAEESATTSSSSSSKSMSSVSSSSTSADLFGSMLARASAELLADGRAAPYVLCGPQTHAKANRARLAAAAAPTLTSNDKNDQKNDMVLKKTSAFGVVFASGEDSVACWSAVLTPAAAAALADVDGFFHVSPVPPAAKLAPNLVTVIPGLAAGTTRLAPAAGVIKPKPATKKKEMEEGSPALWTASLLAGGGKIMAFFDPSIAASSASAASGAETAADVPAARAKSLAELNTLVEGWRGAGFGLTDKDSKAATAARRHFSMGPGWRAVHESVAGASDCGAHLTVEAAVDSLRGARLDFWWAPKADAAAADACCLAALAFVAAQPEVHEVALVAEVKALFHGAPSPSHKARTLDHASGGAKPHVAEVLGDLSARKELAAATSRVAKGAGEVKVPAPKRSLNFMAVQALQSGDVGTSPLWDAGITGGSQLVQVTDTGFDDASCFLRDSGATDGDLTGSFNGDVQVARSTWDAPVTDLTKRKVVQYVGIGLGGDYEYDYFSGHGTHVAGTVAGSIGAGDASSVTMAQEDWYSDCIDYTSYCTSYWLTTEGCDKTCDITRAASEDYTGMAPDAQLMMFDFGNVNGSLAVPSDYQNELFGPAYAAGARIATNSWGGGTMYYSDNSDLDEMIFWLDDFLVLAAAGNDGYSGAETILAPGLGKNVLCVGAAETSASPNTIADFSSRGPTRDMRLKPDLVGPGDPIVSTCASGQPGLGSCQVSSKSGTSMATPAVAGAAALVRQFLVEGHHAIYSADGEASSSYNKVNPSSALLKAILVGSTFPLTFGYDTNGDSVSGTFDACIYLKLGSKQREGSP